MIFTFHFQVQFLIVFVHTAQIQFQSDCAFPKSIAALLTFNAGLFTYMFSAFYVKTYKKNQQQRAEAAAKKELLDEAATKAKSEELHETKNGKAGLTSCMDDFNNNNSSESYDVKDASSVSPLYAKLIQNGHLKDAEMVSKKAI